MRPARLLPALAAAALLSAASAPARPVSADEAGAAAANWLARCPRPLGTALGAAPAAEVRTVRGGDGAALFHVARIEGGGVVVLSAETGVEPVVAFADASGIDETERNPFYAILVADLAFRTERARRAAAPDPAAAAPAPGPGAADRFARAEAAWAELLAPPAPAADGDGSGLPSLPDVRVAPLLQTRWGQSGGAANYYTPNGYVCGCVALAGAQIARYWEFPTGSRPSVSRTCSVNGFETSVSTKGGAYAWGSMPLYFSSLSEAQKQAIGKLCHDFGAATYMDWGYWGSGTGGFCLAEAFADVFGYASARAYVGERDAAVPDAIVERTVFANLDAKCPVSLGIDGHMVDADGYGFADGIPYTHLNMGWSGSGDAWYNLPDVDAANGYQSTILDEIVYNVFPEKTGDLLTGRVLDAAGAPVPGAAVRAVCGADAAAATADAKGVYALWVAGGRTWSVSAAAAGGTASGSFFVPESVSTAIDGRDYEPGTGTPGNRWGADLSLDVSISVPPAAPDGLAASQGTRADRIRLSWRAVPGATSYAVFRAESADGDPVRIATCAGTSYDDTSAASGATWWYWVAGENPGGTGALGGPAEGWRAEDGQTGTLSDGLDATLLAWTTSDAAPWVYDDAVSHDGEDSARSGSEVAANGTTWAETSVEGPAEISFVYRKNFYNARFFATVDGAEVLSDAGTALQSPWISASFEIGEGVHAVRLCYAQGSSKLAGQHNGVWVDRFDVAPPGGYPPDAPSGVLATQGTSADGVSVFWDVVPRAASYVVFRAGSESPASAAQVGTAAGTMFVDEAAEAGTTYWYWVVAVNAAGQSAYGGPASGWRKVVIEDPATRTTPVPVPHAWLDGFSETLAAHGWDYEAAGNAAAANGENAVWECYVAGLDPEDPDARFRAAIDASGATPVVSWAPDLNEGGMKESRVYTVEGRTSLSDPGEDWRAPDEDCRFFRVRVSLPE